MSVPLNCYSGLSTDMFAGWYPDEKGKKCTRFCFWNVNSDISNSTFLPNPHVTTKAPDGSRWGCLVDASDDDVYWSNASDYYHDYTGEVFPYLRCSNGAGQSLSSAFENTVTSIEFWWSVLWSSILLLFLLQYSCWYQRRKLRCQRQLSSTIRYRDDIIPVRQEDPMSKIFRVTGRSIISGDMIDGAQNVNVDSTTSTTIDTTKEIRSNPPYSPGCHTRIRSNVRKWCSTLSKSFLHLILLIVIFLSTLSLLEIQKGVELSFALQQLTPACSVTDRTCPDGLKSIHRPSKDIPNLKDMVPFSYLIASDSQLDWFDGESASIGRSNYPLPCSETDSCSSCTKKVAKYTNAQMKRSFETLIRGEGYVDGPIPKGLVLNGDLTQYFHRSEKQKYENIFHNIEGLDEFFPSLGNHDYDQGRATFDGDAWYQGHCNGMHAISYIRSAFCGKIHKFDAKSRLTRFHSESLAYSWEEGRYHFVHVHFYPTYENAALNIRSSLDWLENDLQLASAKNYTSVLFVHAAGGLSVQMMQVLLDNKVAVIFAGHLHRCFGKKCVLLQTLNTEEVLNFRKGELHGASKRIEKCFPASAGLCSTRANGNGLFYIQDKIPDLVLPHRKLVALKNAGQVVNKCSLNNSVVFVNETDNTVICREIVVSNTFPHNGHYGYYRTPFIPIVWSGSSSFETFIKADFNEDRIVINSMTATRGNEGKRYIDVFTLPNAIYPFHETSDLDEFVIFN